MNVISKTQKRRRTKRINKSLKLPQFSFHTTPIKLLSWLIVLFTSIALVVILRSDYWHIQSHICTYFEQAPCPDIIEAELSNYNGKNILLFSPDLLEQKLLAVEPRAKSVNVFVQLPHIIQVEFMQEDLLANVKIATNSASLLVSNSYIVTSQSLTPNARIPEVIYPQGNVLRMGDKITDSPLAFSLQIIQELTESFINIHRVIVYSDRLILVDLSKNRQAIFTTHADLSWQVTSLQLILSKATISQDMPVIDVRYEQPVLRPLR
jgi:hypothetical protein